MRATLVTTLLVAAACTGCAQTAPSAPATPAAPPPAPVAAAPPAAPMKMPPFTPPSHSPAAVTAGTYKIEPTHTQVLFSVLHLGVSTFYGSFSDASGTVTLDPKHPDADVLDVSVPISSVYTSSAKLTEELKSPPWFDAAQYPVMTFKSTKVVMTGKTTAKVIGDLTLHGVTKPVTLSARFIAAGQNPMMQALNVGFDVTGSIKRSEFGMSTAIPFVSDETKIMISAVFAQ